MKTPFKSLEFIYQDTEIHFLVSENKNVMINATDMAKAFDKKTNDFLRLDATKKYIDSYLCYGKSRNIIKEDVISVNKKLGTFMIRPLALKFASWLDSDFEVWIYNLTDNLLFGNFNLLNEKTINIHNSDMLLESLKQEIIKGNNTVAIDFVNELENNKNLKKQKTSLYKNHNKAVLENLFSIAGIDLVSEEKSLIK